MGGMRRSRWASSRSPAAPGGFARFGRPAGLHLLSAGALVLSSTAILGATATPAVADGPTTFANTTTIAVPATGSANQIGTAAPYPSSISVSGLTGVTTKVTAQLNNVTHSSLNDVDALLVAPSGASLVVLSDAGGRTSLAWATNATLTFDDAATGSVPAGNIATGMYRPTNTDDAKADVFAAPAPTPSAQITMAGAFSGINPNGTWQLYVVDDTGGDVGTIAGGWSLTITTAADSVATTTVATTSKTPSTTGDSVTFAATVTAGGSPVTTGSVQFADGATALGAPVPVNASGVATLHTSALAEGTHTIRATYGGSTGFLTSNATVTQRVDNVTTVSGSTFCNTGPIVVPSVGPAQPYPSNITVSGLSGSISQVTASLRGVSHTVPVDLDVLLAGPTPTTNVTLLSDAGGTAGISGATITFDDDAPGAVPASLTSGTYRPTDVDSGPADAFPAPAPARSSATGLATFDGSSPNGTWSLWVVDDATGDSGSISGGWCLTVTTTAPTTTTLTSGVNPSTIGQPVTFTATVASAGTPVSAGTVSFTADGSGLGTPVAVAADGTATLTTSALSEGTHHIVAMYTGTGGYLDSSGSLTQAVDLIPTDTSLAPDHDPVTAGQPVTFTATVTAAGARVSGGTVTFTVDGTVTGAAVPLGVDGTATLTTSTLPAGSHTVLARYNGTGTYEASQDDSAVTVNPVVNTRPVLTVPESITVDAASASGAVVSYSATATDAEDGSLTPTCAPASGSTFPVGTTTVTCTAEDSAGGHASGSFTVTVNPLPPTPTPPTPTTPPAPVTPTPPAPTPPTPAPVTPAPPAPPAPVTTTLKARSYFDVGSTTLSRAEKRALRKLVAQIPGGTTVTAKVTGVVRADGATKADKRRALARAKAVRHYLERLGLTGDITVSDKGRTHSRTAKARRVNVTITYTR